MKLVDGPYEKLEANLEMMPTTSLDIYQNSSVTL